MISDGTGITAEALGDSLTAQFASIPFKKITIPYVDSPEKALQTVEEINKAYTETGIKPLVFMTLVNPALTAILHKSKACVFDLINSFMAPLEQELGIARTYAVGLSHGLSNNKAYNLRIEAVDYAIGHDDGLRARGYDKADIILIGVSRCGKTPSCLYMALQFGILAANYPFTEEDLTFFRLPESLKPFKNKLFGLTIDKERLQQIRSERRPGSPYASPDQCNIEIQEVESMYKRENIPFLNSTRCSVEEIATRIMAASRLKRRF